MERGEVIAAAAQRLRVRYLEDDDEYVAALAFVRRVCDALDLEILAKDRSDVMLGGAHSRIQLIDPAQPELGGFVWVAADLWQSDPTFAAYALAHELGHFVLHRGERLTVFRPCAGDAIAEEGDTDLLAGPRRAVEEYAPQARREREANLFAAELLAPRATVRRLFAEQRLGSAELATTLGISPTLAERRLLAAVLAPTRPRELDAEAAAEARAPETVESAASGLLAALDAHQYRAATAPGPALVVAGPGTGKTATLVARAGYLLGTMHRAPEEVLALTFSNAAAGEMRERLMAEGLPGERMPVMTIHSFAALLLRDYASRVPHTPDEAPLAADFRLLDAADQYLLLEELLPDLALHYYRALDHPTRHLSTLINDFSAARDGLLTPDDYVALVEAMPLAPASDADLGDEWQAQAASVPTQTFTAEQQARARERAEAYRVYDRALRQRGLLDFGGLIQRAVELLRADPAVLAAVRARFPEVLVDEFQDTNAAAGALILLAAGDGVGLWVVGDANQSIYRWRGASPHNLARLREHHPTLASYPLLRCYRSVPEIVALGSHMADRMSALAAAAAPTAPAALTAPSAPSAPPDAHRLEPVRTSATATAGQAPAAPACAGVFPTVQDEHAYLISAIRAASARGTGYQQQAILCRTHTLVREVASALEAAGIPVAMVGDIFAYEEVKDALCLLRLAVGHDASPLVRAAGLLRLVGVTNMPPRQWLAPVPRAVRQLPLPNGLTDATRVRQALATVQVRDASEKADGAPLLALLQLGRVATDLHYANGVGLALTRALLTPGGTVWQLVRRADALDVAPQRMRPGEAQTALAALGALVSIALSFDRRWANEPDFKRRLSRAAAQGTVGFVRSAAPVRPDAREAPPGSDVLPDILGDPLGASPMSAPTTRPIAAPATTPLATPPAPAVAAFLHYLAAMRAANVSINAPAADDDTVRVMTLHTSKGLEFPIVYLPYLVQERFPGRKPGGRDVVSPPGFREIDAPGQVDAEQRCLFYVGVTRARDQIVLTRAERYKTAAKRSVLLQLIDGAETITPVAALPPTSMPTRDATLERPEHPERAHDEELASDASGDPLPTLPTYALWELELYLDCPRKYKYARHYRFFDERQGAVLRFHRYVRHAQRVLRDAQQTNQPGQPPVPFDALAPRLRATWQEDGPVGHAYEDYYWRHAEAILRQEWTALASVAATPGVRGTLAREVTATLRRCCVTVLADEVREEPGASADAPARFTLVRQHTGLPAKSHRDDLALPLYVLATRQEHPGAEVRVLLRYLGNALRADDPDERPGETVDLTEEATKVAEKYAQPDHKRSKLDKLDEAADGIAAEEFPPDPSEHKCAACAFCYICPADPEEVEVEEARPVAPVAAQR